MRWIETLNSGAFRFALLVAGMFALGSLTLLAIVDVSMAHYADEATRGSLTVEASGLVDDDRARGRPALVSVLKGRQTGDDPQFHYALLDGQGHRVTGDLMVVSRRPGFGQALIEADAKAGEAGAIPALTTTLADGAALVVATDSYDIDALRRRLDLTTLSGGIMVTLFALVGGYYIGGRFLRRLDGVNHAVARIIEGNLNERLPAIGMSREFDALSRNLNAMLDRIGVLMDSMRQVSTDIAHDLRTPLTRLRHQLETAQTTDPEGRAAEAITVALHQTDDMLRVFHALLRIGTLEGGIGRDRFAAVDLSEIAARVVAAYQPAAEDSGRQLIANITPGVAVIGDTELLMQLLTNLLENALTHTPPGSLITLSLEVTGGRPRITISDDGPGIPAHERGRVMQRFYRLDASRGTPGSGLGLALANAIAALHQAKIDLTSAEPGLRVRLSFARPV